MARVVEIIPHGGYRLRYVYPVDAGDLAMQGSRASATTELT